MPPTSTLTTPSDREIVITREFNGPRKLVFEAFRKPELIKRWLTGPDGWSLEVCEVAQKVGGSFRYVWKKDTGTVMGMGGILKELAPPDRMVHTELFDEDWTGGETLVTTTFTEHAGKTTVSMTVLYASKAARDGAAMSGMKAGMDASFAKLDAVLASVS